MDELRLTPTSWIVLGFVSLLGEATPYDIKRLVAQSVGQFWSFPHSQLYAEPERLAVAGYLDESREEGGRRRKRYTLTERGRDALERWRGEPTTALPEIRDLATLQLFFGGDPRALARVQLATAREHLAELESLIEPAGALDDPGPALALEYGLSVARASADFWEKLAGD